MLSSPKKSKEALPPRVFPLFSFAPGRADPGAPGLARRKIVTVSRTTSAHDRMVRIEYLARISHQLS